MHKNTKYLFTNVIYFHGDYVSTDNKIFFQSNEVKNAHYITFKVTNKTKEGYYYSYDNVSPKRIKSNLIIKS